MIYSALHVSQDAIPSSYQLLSSNLVSLGSASRPDTFSFEFVNPSHAIYKVLNASRNNICYYLQFVNPSRAFDLVLKLKPVELLNETQTMQSH